MARLSKSGLASTNRSFFFFCGGEGWFSLFVVLFLFEILLKAPCLCWFVSASATWKPHAPHQTYHSQAAYLGNARYLHSAPSLQMSSAVPHLAAL